MDRDFFEEQARNQAIKEAEDAEEYEWVEVEDENEDDEVENEDEDENEAEEIFVKEVQQPVLSRSRNRPKKEI